MKVWAITGQSCHVSAVLNHHGMLTSVKVSNALLDGLLEMKSESPGTG